MLDNDENNLTNPHDKIFKTAMTDIRVAQDFLFHYLPVAIKKLINLNSLQIQKGSFVDEKFKTSETDILYQVELINNPKKKAYIYLLIEHQSKPDKWLPYRLVKYSCSFADQYLQQNKKASALPLIFPLVFYNGRKKYSYSLGIYDLFAEHKELARQIFSSPFTLIDLNEIEDEEIRQHKWSGLMEMAMKHIARRDLKEALHIIGEMFIGPLATKNGTEKYIISVIRYIIFKAGVGAQGEEAEECFQILRGYTRVNKQLEDKTMTMAEYFRQQGMQQMVKSLYQKLHDVDQVAYLADLKVEEVKKILEQKV